MDFDGELRDLGRVPEALLHPVDRKLADASALWLHADATKPNRFDAFRGSTLHIVFQFPEDLKSHQRSLYSPWWDDWKAVLEPLIAHATRSFQYAQGRTARIMLARLLPGRQIARHVDTNPSAEVPHKIHIPLLTSDAVRFHIGHGEYRLQRGHAYEVNNRKPHAVENYSSLDRIHLIFDYFDAQ